MLNIQPESFPKQKSLRPDDGQDLKPEQREAIEKEAAAFLERSFVFFENSKTLPREKLFYLLNAGAGVKDLLHMDSGTPIHEGQYRIRIFFKVFVDFCTRIHRVPERRATLHAFLDQWHNVAFVDAFEQPTTALELGEVAKLGLHLSRIPETHDNFAGNLRQTFLFTLERTPDAQARKAIMNEIWERLSVEEQIDFTEYVLTLYFHLKTAATEDVVMRDTRFWEDFLQDVASREDTSAFVQYGARYALNIIHSSSQRWSRFMRAYSDHGGRFHPVDSAARKESAVWKQVLKPDKDSYVDIYTRRIAKDAVATFDNAWTPQSFTYVDTNEERERVPREAHFTLFEDIPDHSRVQVKGVDRSVESSVLLQAMHRPGIRLGIEKDLGVSLNQISLREQIQLLTYLARVDQKIAYDGFTVIQKHGLNAARTFLSCEHGKHFGDAILDIAKKLDPASAKAVFAKYCEIIDATERTTEELLSEFYVTEHGRTIDRGKVNEEILVRAKEVLALCAKELQGAGENPVTGADILQKLESVQKDTVLFASLFKTMAKGREVDFRELRGVTFEQKRPVDIGETEKKEMTDILKENWRTQKVSVADWVEAGFEKKLDTSNTDTRFYVLKKDHHVMAFMRFDERPDLGANALYAGSLNVSPMLRGSALGEAVLRSTVDEEAKEHTIYADFFPEISAGTMYVEQMGWVVTGVEEVQVDAKGAREQRFVMVRDDERHASLRTRHMEKSDLVRMADGRARDGIRVIRFDFPQEVERFADEVKRATQSGHSMTRYFSDDSASRTRYAAFEPTTVYSAASRIAA